MLARTELSKARSSVRRRFARDPSPPSRGAIDELDAELRRLSTAIQHGQPGAEADEAGLRERRQRLWEGDADRRGDRGRAAHDLS
jgi:hypothetical protein